MSADLSTLLASVSDQPFLLGLILFGATLVAEDVATIAAGVLVARTGADPVIALSAVILGTAVGDLALYALGRWGAGFGLSQRLRMRQDVRRAESWVAGRALMLVFVARFIPGSRLPIFTASGLVSAPLVPVAAIIVLTTPFWTGALFLLARSAGEASAQGLIEAALPTALLLIGIMTFSRRARQIGATPAD